MTTWENIGWKQLLEVLNPTPPPKAGLVSMSNHNKLYSAQSGKAMRELHLTPSPQVTLARSPTSNSTFVSLLTG